jgi:uncharacterized protein (DUF1810 family)
MNRFDLDRFRVAQARDFAQAREELREGVKRGHWMWWMFPQLRGLGLSPTSAYYGLGSRAEAVAFLADPELRARLTELCDLLLTHPDRSARDIFGSPDDLKLRSCMTLFAALPEAPPVFAAVLERFFAGEADARTLALLA